MPCDSINTAQDRFWSWIQPVVAPGEARLHQVIDVQRPRGLGEESLILTFLGRWEKVLVLCARVQRRSVSFLLASTGRTCREMSRS